MTTMEVRDSFESSKCSQWVENHEKVLLFFVSGDCPPCEIMKDRMQGLLESLKWKSECILFRIHAESAMELIRKYEVKSVPTVFFIENGKKVGNIIGTLKDATILRRLKRFLGVSNG